MVRKKVFGRGSQQFDRFGVRHPPHLARVDSSVDFGRGFRVGLVLELAGSARLPRSDGGIEVVIVARCRQVSHPLGGRNALRGCSLSRDYGSLLGERSSTVRSSYDREATIKLKA